MMSTRFRYFGVGALVALLTLPIAHGSAQTVPRPAGQRAHAATMTPYHFTSSLVPSVGAQVTHIDGILMLNTAASGPLSGATLRLWSGNGTSTLPVTGAYTRTLSIAMDVGGLHVMGQSSAISANRLTGVFVNASGGTIGFWVATAITDARAGAKYLFLSKITAGPDKGTSYDGALELWGDKYGGLLAWLTLKDGTLLRGDGQDVNGNVNMLLIVRAGTPMFVSGTTTVTGGLRGTLAGPLAGDEGGWLAHR